MSLKESVTLNESLIWFDVSDLIDYVNSTRSDDGGYCYYRFNESDAADTFYAAHALTVLHHPAPGASKTASFLQQFQPSDGSFLSTDGADYVRHGLCLVNSARDSTRAPICLIESHPGCTQGEFKASKCLSADEREKRYLNGS